MQERLLNLGRCITFPRPVTIPVNVAEGRMWLREKRLHPPAGPFCVQFGGANRSAYVIDREGLQPIPRRVRRDESVKLGKTRPASFAVHNPS